MASGASGAARTVRAEHGECVRCHCDCSEDFQKVLELKDLGLVVYRHVTRRKQKNKITGLLETCTETTQNVFILQNTRSTELVSAEYLSTIENIKIRCPRCRQLAAQLHALLQRAPDIKRRHVTGICDLCLMRGQPCLNCEKILNKFFEHRDRRVSDDTRTLIRQWLSEINHMLAAVDRRHGVLGSERVRASSDISIDRILTRSQRDTRQLDIKPLFRPRRLRLDERGHFAEDRLRFPGNSMSRIDLGGEWYRGPTRRRDRDGDLEWTLGRGGQLRLARPCDRDETSTRRSHSEEWIPVARDAARRDRGFAEWDRSDPGGYMRSGDRIDYTKADHVSSRRYRDDGEGSEIFEKGDALYKDWIDATRKTTIDDGKERGLVQKNDRSAYEIDKNKERSMEAIADDGRMGKYDRKRRPGAPDEGIESKTLKDRDSEIVKGERVEKKSERPAEHKDQFKREKDYSVIDKGGKRQRQKGERVFSTKGKVTEETQQKREKEINTKDKGGQEHKQKLKNEETTLYRSSQKQKQKAEKESRTKKKGEQENKQQKGKAEKDEVSPKPKDKHEKKMAEKDKTRRETKQKEKTDPDKGVPESKKREKGAISMEKGPANIKRKSKGEEDMDTKDVSQQNKQANDKKEKEKPDPLMMAMEQQLKGRDFSSGFAREKQKGTKDVVEVLKLDKKTGKKGDETKRGKHDKMKDKRQDNVLVNMEDISKIEVNTDQVQVRRASPDDLFLKLVRLKQADMERKSIFDPQDLIRIENIIRDHFDTKHHGKTFDELCPFCRDSDFGDDTLERPEQPELAEVIIGNQIHMYKPPLEPCVDPDEVTPVEPILFQTTQYIENIVQRTITPNDEESLLPEENKDKIKKSSKKPVKQVKVESEAVSTKGIIRYALSDRSFIEKGWTMLPTEKVVRKLNVYRMRPARPEFDWFERNKRKRLMTYSSGERLAEIDDDGRGRWYYRNGRLALDYYNAEAMNAQLRYVIWSNGEPDERGRARPYTILATFDYLGNGIVFDHTGKIRLKYNQMEGIVLDRSLGPSSHWKWHTLNEPPVLAKVMIDTTEESRDSRLEKLGAGDSGDYAVRVPPDHDEMLAIEFNNFVRAKSEKLTQTFKPFQIKMKALKINEQFSLKVLDQATVHLLFRDGSTHLELNLGLLLDHREIVDTDMAEMGSVSSEVERCPARSASLAALQRGVAAARRMELARLARDRRLRAHLPPQASADRLTAPASRRASSQSTAGDVCRCARKPSGSNLYYDNRIF